MADLYGHWQLACTQMHWLIHRVTHISCQISIWLHYSPSWIHTALKFSCEAWKSLLNLEKFYIKALDPFSRTLCHVCMIAQVCKMYVAKGCRIEFCQLICCDQINVRHTSQTFWVYYTVLWSLIHKSSFGWSITNAPSAIESPICICMEIVYCENWFTKRPQQSYKTQLMCRVIDMSPLNAIRNMLV